MDHYEKAVRMMDALYGKNIAMPLATVKNGQPNIRVINVYYKDGAFYAATYAASNKMKEIAVNPHVAICRDLFVAHGVAENLGHPTLPANSALRDELRTVFYVFYDRHVDEADAHTCFLKIRLTDALVFANDSKYFIDFETKTARRKDFIADVII